MTLRLYDPIDSWGEFWGVSAKEFVETLDGIPDTTSEIRLLINSPGGEVWDGLAILNALRAHPARVVAVVEGIAASAASFIAVGVDELVMMKNSELFIHNAWGYAIGNAAVMTSTAEQLSHLDRNLADIYAAKSGESVDHWLALMGDDTYFSAEEAVEAGLADRVEGVGDAAAARARFDLSQFSARMPRADSKLPASMPGGTNRKETVVANGDLTAGDRAGLEPIEAGNSIELLGDVAADDAPSGVVINTLPAGAMVVDKAAFEQLQANAQAGADALAEIDKQRRDSIVAQALNTGQIAPSARDTWRAQLDESEEGTTQLLASLPKNTIPVVETGHTVETSADDAAYNRVYGTTEKGA